MKFETNKSYYIQASRRCGKTTLLSKILVKNIIKNLKSKEELTFMVISFSLPSLNNLKVMVEKELTKKLTNPMIPIPKIPQNKMVLLTT